MGRYASLILVKHHNQRTTEVETLSECSKHSPHITFIYLIYICILMNKINNNAYIKGDKYGTIQISMENRFWFL